MFFPLLLMCAKQTETLTEIEIKKAICSQKPAKPVSDKDVITGSVKRKTKRNNHRSGNQDVWRPTCNRTASKIDVLVEVRKG